MSETFALYRPESNSYQEYAIIFGESPKQSELSYHKVIHIGEDYPRYITTSKGKSLEIPKGLPKLSDGLKEIVFQIEGTMIVRVSVRDFESQIPDTQKKTTQAVEDMMSPNEQ